MPRPGVFKRHGDKAVNDATGESLPAAQLTRHLQPGDKWEHHQPDGSALTMQVQDVTVTPDGFTHVHSVSV